MINNITLMGRLTAAPELKITQSGANVTGFCIAVERRFQQKDGEKQSDFINCVAWRNTAEFIARYFGKGDMIAVTGELQTRKYKDKDGNNRMAFEVIVDNASFCGGKNNGGNGSETAPKSNDDINVNVDVNDDDLPF